MNIRKNIAFTFIELLVAITIFSIISTSIYYTLHAGLKTWERENIIIKDNQQMRIFFDIVSSDLRNIAVYSGIKPQFYSQSISFPAIIDISDEHAINRKLVKMMYYFDTDRGLFVRTCATQEDGFNEDYAKAKVLLRDIEEANFEYCYESTVSQGDYVWKDAWGFEDKIPRAIKISVTQKDSPLIRNNEPFEKIVVIPMGELGKLEE